MAIRVQFELLLTEHTLNVLKEYNINVCQIAIESILEEVKKHSDISRNLSQLNVQQQNIDLKNEVDVLKQELHTREQVLENYAQLYRQNQHSAFSKLIKILKNPPFQAP